MCRFTLLLPLYSPTPGLYLHYTTYEPPHVFHLGFCEM